MSLPRTLLAFLLSLLLSLNGAAAVAAGVAPCPMQGGAHGLGAAHPCMMDADAGMGGCCDPEHPGHCAACHACGLAGALSLLPAPAGLPLSLPRALRTEFPYAPVVFAAPPSDIWRPPSLLS